MIKRVLMFCLLLVGCQSDPKIEPSDDVTESRASDLKSRINLNVSILIDLSDRIDPQKFSNPTMEYFQRDTGYISSVVRAFRRHVLNKKLILINDRMQTFIDPLPQNPDIVRNLKEMRLLLNRSNVSKSVLQNMRINYLQNASQIYDQSISDKNYIGSDIWRFFKSNVKDYCIKEDMHNVLVVLTDGYIYHQNSNFKDGNLTTYIGRNTFTSLGLTNTNWRSAIEQKKLGFLPAASGLGELKVLVLGLNPSSQNPFEEEVLKAYWENWLMAMGVKEFMIAKADLPANLDESIEDFILLTQSSP